LPEEPCQCSDCLRFYKEHDRLIREFPTLRQQQELNWASLQAFRTLCGKVSSELQKHQNCKKKDNDSVQSSKSKKEDSEIDQAITDLDSINAHLFSIEVLMEKIFDSKVSESIEQKFKEIAGEIAPDPLNVDRIRLNRLLHQTPDLPDKN
tara:strand:+ start:104 stop:553 length:450 start_codon:yes stop_codon:yes gene_type:complete